VDEFNYYKINSKLFKFHAGLLPKKCQKNARQLAQLPENMPRMIATRRNLLKASAATLAAPGLMLTTTQAWAGRQLEEPLMDSVRTALSGAIAFSAPPVPEFANTDAKMAYLRWLGDMSERLKTRKRDDTERQEFLQTVWYESKRAGLDVSLVLGLIQVESAFRKFAISRVGARGYMQVMPFWSRLIGDGDHSKLFHMQTNLRFGCVILRHYMERDKFDEFMALGRYNGSRGRAEYPNAVFAAQKRWVFSG
jgi:soluble lytic murein transglycosylase-like protein